MTQLPWAQATSTTAGTTPNSDDKQQQRQHQQQQQQQPASANGSVSPDDLLKLKVLELRQLCHKRGLPQYGRKDELVQRLLSRRQTSAP
jgi:hypothetical protein